MINFKIFTINQSKIIFPLECDEDKINVNAPKPEKHNYLSLKKFHFLDLYADF